MDWFKNISWLKVLAGFTSLVVYLGVFVGLAAVLLTFNHITVNFPALVAVVFLGSFMVIGRDIVARPLSLIAMNIVLGETWSKGLLPKSTDLEDDSNEDE